LPIYVFSIDIPFKGSHSHSNMRSKVTAVSYLHSGVNDTAVHVNDVSGVNDSAVNVTAVSITPLCRVEPNHIPA
jgi:hypothetical protein